MCDNATDDDYYSDGNDNDDDTNETVIEDLKSFWCWCWCWYFRRGEDYREIIKGSFREMVGLFFINFVLICFVFVVVSVLFFIDVFISCYTEKCWNKKKTLLNYRYYRNNYYNLIQFFSSFVSLRNMKLLFFSKSCYNTIYS